MAIVYIHKRKDIDDQFLSVFYVGIGKHISRSITKKDRSCHWNNVVNKYGFIEEVTHKDILWEEACSIEKYLILFYGRKDLKLGNLVNLTDGGEGTINHYVSEDLKKHLAKINTGKKHKEESKKKMSESRKGDKNHAFGKKMSKETKIKLSISHTGKKYSSERIEQMKITFAGKNNPNYGKKASDETRKKISESLKGEKHPMYGKKGINHYNYGRIVSEETREKIKLALLKRKNKLNESITI